MIKSIHQRPKPFIVVPLYNEERRFSSTYWISILRITPNVEWCFVNDGSTDDTLERLQEISQFTNVQILSLPKNLGKAEAVRAGVLQGLQNSTIIGFMDSDPSFATKEVQNFIQIATQLLENQKKMVLASRIKFSGTEIERLALRHLLGRIIATYFGFRWKLIPYDTQCGLKLFKIDCPEVWMEPFRTRWLFDIEIMKRLGLIKNIDTGIQEIPLRFWKEVPGSHIRAKEYFSILRQVLWISSMLKRALDS